MPRHKHLFNRFSWMLASIIQGRTSCTSGARGHRWGRRIVFDGDTVRVYYWCRHKGCQATDAGHMRQEMALTLARGDVDGA
jgi:hypothetical protein